MTWRRFGVLVRQLPRESATVRKILGDHAEWTLDTHLLATAVDAIRAGNWQRGGGKGARPKPIKRPRSKNDGVARYGRPTGRPNREVVAFLDQFKPPRKE